MVCSQSISQSVRQSVSQPASQAPALADAGYASEEMCVPAKNAPPDTSSCHLTLGVAALQLTLLTTAVSYSAFIAFSSGSLQRTAAAAAASAHNRGRVRASHADSTLHTWDLAGATHHTFTPQKAVCHYYLLEQQKELSYESYLLLQPWVKRD